ncbi:MAG: hypothetical protein H6912_05105 [Kordiimonadaceae bacterium]|nr:hypothetical protein [Kordiimonadaceae bacterium]
MPEYCNSNNVKETKFDYLPFWLAILAFVIIIIFYIVNLWGSISTKSEDWGTFGDYVGGLGNPVIALAVLYYVYHAFKIQKEELRATKEALKTTSDEAVKQTGIAKINTSVITLATICREITTCINHTEKEIIKKRDFLRKAEEIKNRYIKIQKQCDEEGLRDKIEQNESFSTLSDLIKEMPKDVELIEEQKTILNKQLTDFSKVLTQSNIKILDYFKEISDL